MSVKINLPPLKDVTPSTIKTYLFQLQEQLNYILNDREFIASNNQTKENINLAVSAEVKQIENTQAAKIKKLRDEIIKTADEISQNFVVELTERENSIYASVAEEYIAKSKEGELNECYEYITQQISSGVIENFSRTVTLADETSKEFKEYAKQFDAYIKRGLLGYDEEGKEIFGIEIGDISSPFKGRFVNDKLSFIQGMTEVAYISNDTLYITRAEILHLLSIGNSTNGYFDWVSLTSGLAVVWRE